MILVGIPLPFSGEIDLRVMNSIKKMKGEFDLYIVRDSIDDLGQGDRLWRIARARERIRLYFLAHPEYDQLMFIDSDIIVPVDTLDTLLGVQADIVIHSYQSIEVPGYRATAKVDIPTVRKINDKVFVLSGMGCTLIKRPVLEKCDFIKGVANWNTLLGEDVSFLVQAKDNGFKTEILEDKLQLVHLEKDRENFWKQLKDNPEEFRRWRS